MSIVQSLTPCPNATRIKYLSKGGQARIYLARRTRDNAIVVEKEFIRSRHAELAGRPRYQSRRYTHHTRFSVVKEMMEALGRNEHIVEVLYFPTLQYQAMQLEYCDLGDLNQLCYFYRRSNTKMSESFLWHLFSSLAKAICFLHIGGLNPVPDWRPIIHRDLKPDNVLLQTDPTQPLGFPKIKLNDFDFADFFDPEDCVHFGGHPAYLPPEQSQPSNSRRPRATPAGDVWSIGAMVYQARFERSPVVDYIPDREEEGLSESVVVMELENRSRLETYLRRALCRERERISAEGLVRLVTPQAEWHVRVFRKEMALGFPVPYTRSRDGSDEDSDDSRAGNMELPLQVLISLNGLTEYLQSNS